MHELFLHYSLIKNALLVQSKFGALDLILFWGGGASLRKLGSGFCSLCFGVSRGHREIWGVTSGEGELKGSRARPPPPTAQLFSASEPASSHGCFATTALRLIKLETQ